MTVTAPGLLQPNRTLAVVALLVLVPAASIGVAAALWVLPGPIGQGIYGICKIWLLALPLIWRWRVERQPLNVRPPRREGMGVAFLCGIGIAAVILVAFWLIRDMANVDTLRAAAARNGLDQPLRYTVVALYECVLNSLLEEYVWRWFVFQQCAALMPGRTAVVVSAVLFTVHHVIALRLQFGWLVTVLGSLGVFAGGVLWGWMYWRYERVWPGWICHVLADAAIFIVGAWILFAR